MRFIRRVRALVATALVWGGMYAVAGALFSFLQDYWGVSAIDLSAAVAHARWVAFRWAVIGAISGGVFGAIFAWLERHSTIAELTWRRVVLWGAAGGMALPLLNGGLILSGVLSAGVGVGTLAAHTVFGGMLGGACAAAWLGIGRRDGDSAPPGTTLKRGRLGRSLPAGSGGSEAVPWHLRPASEPIPRGE